MPHHLIIAADRSHAFADQYSRSLRQATIMRSHPAEKKPAKEPTDDAPILVMCDDRTKDRTDHCYNNAKHL